MQRNAWVVALTAAFTTFSAHAQQADSPPAGDPAQEGVVSYQAVGNAAGVTKIYRSIRAADPADARKTVVVEQVLKQVAPGSVTLVRGEQSAEAARHRQQQCAALGAVDATEEADVTFDERILDFALCKSANPQPAQRMFAAAGMRATALAAAPKANDEGITIIVPAVQGKLLQPTQLPVHFWVSSVRAGEISLSLQAPNFGFVNFRGTTNGGVYNFQPVFTVKGSWLGTYPVTAIGCAPIPGGCVKDERGRFTVVR
ncbi:hypothetical protein Bsp3421_001552 [Burkholderia sp. FERM BP-3421]|jgi:hypothetical protein|uniref:hypothetical protein n=1 Tax=Burkholderia sp. FERM BP-3421 TaxID=1494466 RepID=UPI002361B9E4|nr:hypothetical protein [Burkholderia sp. FERM BP-3421]WDD91618.1 hypothetical protein Bsp3421_001552 [Burkholderia sp. FERM BP-3421]